MKLTESLNTVLPQKIKQGDTIGITAPSSQIEPKNVSSFAKVIESLGFDVLLGNTITSMHDHDYNAGTAESRAGDLNRMIKDKSVRAIFAGAGGFGAQVTAKYMDYNALLEDPKPIIGFSDTTFLLNAITTTTGITTFLGPTAEITDPDRDKESINLALSIITGDLKPPFTYNNFDGTLVRRISKAGYIGTGRLVGGNLTMVQTSLGTPKEIDTDGKILLLEEIGESSYSVERSLDHLVSAGKFQNVKGVVFGEFTEVNREPIKDARDSNPSINEILVKKFSNANYPVIVGYNFSHGDYNTTLPIGATARIDSTKRTLELLTKVVK